MVKGVRRSIRNPEILPGLRRAGRVAQGKANGQWKFSKKGDVRKPEVVKAARRTARANARAKRDITKTRYYGADDIKIPLRSNKGSPKGTKLKRSLTPGTVVILIAGRFRGKRVVFLKQLSSGLLLVTGPYKVNGVPLRRVNQAYVIATSTKIDIKGLDVSKVSDDFFKRVYPAADKKGKEFLETKEGEKKKEERSSEKKAAQKAVDSFLKPIIAKVPQLSKYLGAKFSLTNNQRPHLMKF